MNRYEVLILTIPEITSDETTHLEKEFGKTVQQAGGDVISFERWGKLRLAYPVNDNEYGVYFLSRFEVDEAKKQELLETLKAFLAVKCNNVVARFMTCVLDPNASLAYERPESLEDAPTRDVGQFLRENKMEGLLPKSAPGDEKKAPSSDSVVAEKPAQTAVVEPVKAAASTETQPAETVAS